MLIINATVVQGNARYRGGAQAGEAANRVVRVLGALAALMLAGLSGALFFAPMATVTRFETLRLGFSGVSQNAVQTQQFQISFLRSGYAGQEAVILIHGLCPNAVLEWRDTLPALAKARFMAIAPNLVGFDGSYRRKPPPSAVAGWEAGKRALSREHPGKETSKVPPAASSRSFGRDEPHANGDAQRTSGLSIHAQASAVYEMMHALGLRRASIVGFGVGADVALDFAASHGDNVRRLILVSGGLVGAAGAARMRRALFSSDEGAELKPEMETLFPRLPRRLDFAYRKMAMEAAATRPYQEALLDSLPQDEHRLRGILGRIFNIPVGIIWGGQDPVLSFAYALRLRRALPGSSLVKLDNAGHYPHREQPTAFNAGLLTLLAHFGGTAD